MEEQYEDIDLSELDECLSTPSKLIVLNDDINTFDYVIECLVQVVGHSRTQAEQCTLIIHNRGKCTVKEGTLSKITTLNNILTNLNLKTEIL